MEDPLTARVVGLVDGLGQDDLRPLKKGIGKLEIPQGLDKSWACRSGDLRPLQEGITGWCCLLGTEWVGSTQGGGQARWRGGKGGGCLSRAFCTSSSVKSRAEAVKANPSAYDPPWQCQAW